MLLFRAILAFIALPGVFAGLIPAFITSHDPYRGHGYLLGIVFVVFGLIILIWCVRDFLVSGHGTLAPWDPPTKLVMVGLYRYSRNPMYVDIIIIIAGLALYTGSVLLAIYGCVLACVFYLRVVFGEEQFLSKQFGKQWSEYVNTVPRWLPQISVKGISTT